MKFVIDFKELKIVSNEYGLKYGKATKSYYREDGFLSLIYIYESGNITAMGDVATAIIIELVKKGIIENNELIK